MDTQTFHEARAKVMEEYLKSAFTTADKELVMENFAGFIDTELSLLVGALSFYLAMLPLQTRERVMADIKDQVMEQARTTGGAIGLLEVEGLAKVARG